MECGCLDLTIFYPFKAIILVRFSFLPKNPFHVYLHPHAAIDSSIDLNPAPRLELSAAIGSKDISIGGEVGFNTTSASFTKYNAGIAFNKPDFSATLMLADKGEALKASYIHYVDRPDELTVAAELAHKLSSSENRFTIGTSQLIDPKTVLKTRFSDDGKAAFQCQRAWRPNSLITLSAEYDSTKIFGSPAKFGLALSLKP
ncbi:mitochondrial outer membrane protein porin 4-like [Trifolium pratense]|uniref:Mitochondrial outer membrane protein porin 4-like n=1 Tax=Trifolium pratense TaxID=57577 RepID=A0A2K3MAD5_TRIPR|nr:mitochondrial outer membrane protein porin 4-like [Trifolium pratense]